VSTFVNTAVVDKPGGGMIVSDVGARFEFFSPPFF